jgi:hypothetical protein
MIGSPSPHVLPLLPLWEKVARTKSATDEGSLSADSHESMWRETPHPDCFAIRPLPQGERCTANAGPAQSNLVEPMQ